MLYSWRWKKIQHTVKGLNLTQALVLRLVNQELNDILPAQTMQELKPLFDKAKLIVSNAVMEHPEKSLMDILNLSSGSGSLSAVPPSVLGELIYHLGDKVNGLYQTALNLDEKRMQQPLQKVMGILEKHELPELVKALKS